MDSAQRTDQANAQYNEEDSAEICGHSEGIDTADGYCQNIHDEAHDAAYHKKNGS